jgi:hypothetical protein
MRNPNLRHEMDHGRGPFHHMVRIGLELADGAKVSSEQPSFPAMPGSGSHRTAIVLNAAPGSKAAVAPGATPRALGFDADGIPVGHALRPQGGGGSQHRQSMGFWSFRLPAPGPMRIHADWPGHFDEVTEEIDATPIVEAAARSVVLWDRH